METLISLTYPKNYGLKDLNCPPKIKEITNFENNLTNLLKNINPKDLYKVLKKYTKRSRPVSAIEEHCNELKNLKMKAASNYCRKSKLNTSKKEQELERKS